VADLHDDDTSPWPPGSDAPRPMAPSDPTSAPAAPAAPAATAPELAPAASPPTAPAPPRAPGAPAASSPGPTGWVPPAPPKPTAPARSGGWDGARIAGIILVLVGLFLLLRRFVPLDSDLVLPVVAVAIGGAMVLGALRPRGRNG
jgi:hypothetical protein